MSHVDAFPTGPQGPTPNIEGLSPFIIESVAEVSEPSVEVDKDFKMVIGGVVQERYSSVRINRPARQRNNSSLLRFDAYVGNDTDRKNWAMRVIDINHPEIELVTVGIKEKENNSGYSSEEITVNGHVWNSLRGKNIGNFIMEIDPDAKKVVFRVDNAVFEDNVEWGTHFSNHVNFVTSRFGTVYAVGSDKDQQPRLVVNDQEWVYSKFYPDTGQSYSGRQEKPKSSDEIENAVVSKNGKVAAVVHSLRAGNAWRQYVFVGDKAGAQEEWKNTLDIVEDIIIDDESGSVAVFGLVETGKKGMIIDDVSFAIPGNPDKLECFKFQDGGVVIQYTDALGKKVTQKISLRPDAAEVQERKVKEEQIEQGLTQLRRLMTNAGISPAEVFARLQRGDALEQPTKRADYLGTELRHATDKNRELEEKLDRKTREGEQATRTHEQEKRNDRTALTTGLTLIQTTLEAAGKATFGSSLKLSAEQMERILRTIQELKPKKE